ncbi:MAG: hypothetical protein E6K78_04215 [Candidatus Eisenbacteria bacterium]|uniref:Isoprenylcysteine carboxylmethyltransferase family protein n=1 Tax=Eiseniibacteriota bacterium TaxID=2212470 RepID=A0A538TVG2_UNCEI|nr:MAG: hypothetical protein E6K78_04215 [Candidatus Eisenbacteria bacterium]
MATTHALSTRLVRWLLISATITLASWGLAGNWRLPLLDVYVAGAVVFFLVAMLILDPAVVRERLRPKEVGIDPKRLALIRLLVLVHLVVGLIDVGRARWSNTVPRPLQVSALVVVAGGAAWVLWAITVNPFFVPVIRIQPERNHQVVTASALALGSWAALVPALAASVLLVRRTADEDRFLQERLEGYGRYAGMVRYRLLPGVW